MGLPELLLRPSVSLGLVTCVLGVLYVLKTQISHPLQSIYWVGRRRGEWFPNSKARQRARLDPGSMHEEGYSNCSKRDAAFYFPSHDGCDTVILPTSQISYLANQPESVVSNTDAMRTILMTDYLFDPHVLFNPVHNFVTRVLLSRNLPQMIPVMADELRDSLEELMGVDTENWKEVHILETFREIAGRTVNRVFTGDEKLSRDRDYLDSLLFVAAEVDYAAAKLRNTPRILRRLLAPYITRPYHKAMRKVIDFTNPLVIKRKEAIARQGKVEFDKELEEPDDFLQYLIQQSIVQKNNIDPTADTISLRLALMNFASVQNLSKAATNTVLDLVNAPPELDVIGTLQDEISAVFAEESGQVSKEHLAKMERLDSAIKESMRVSQVSTVGLQRMVRSPQGVPISGGHKVPKGTMVGTSAISLHLDEDYYPDPRQWKPFRFYDDSHRAAEATAETDPATVKSDQHMRQKHNALTYATDEYLAFGRGTHACPGRFYAASLLKTLIMLLLQEYDLRPQTKRAENIWVSGALVPSGEATVEVKKKTKEKKAPIANGTKQGS